MNTIKGYFIDVTKQTVTEITLPNDHDHEYRELLKTLHAILDCDFLDTACGQRNGDHCWVDDEGLDKPPLGWWRVPGAPQAYINNAVWLGSSGENEGNPRTPISRLKKNIKFYEPEAFDPEVIKARVEIYSFSDPEDMVQFMARRR